MGVKQAVKQAMDIALIESLHVISILKIQQDLYQVTCSCGWLVSTLRMADATYYGDSHVKEMIRVKSTDPEPIKSYGVVASRQSNLAYHLIPWEAIKQLGDICLEGERVYKDKAINGKFIKNLLTMEPKALEEWIEERGWNHALPHLLKALQGDRKEKHWAKVMWFCGVMIELEKMKEAVITKEGN